MTEFIPSQNGKGYHEVVTPAHEERALAKPHYIEDGGRLRAVHPAIGSTLGMLVDPATNGLQAILRLDHAYGPTSLMQILSVEELRALATGMVDIADQMEAAAADMLAQALAKKPGA